MLGSESCSHNMFPTEDAVMILLLRCPKPRNPVKGMIHDALGRSTTLERLEIAYNNIGKLAPVRLPMEQEKMIRLC